MNVISPKQCRAARALLDITRADLSTLSNVSPAAIGGFETEATAPRAASISMIRAALEGKGIEFLDDDGVRERKNTVRVYQGEKIHRQLLDEIYSDLKDVGGEILIKGVTETSWGNGDDKAFLDIGIHQVSGLSRFVMLDMCQTLQARGFRRVCIGGSETSGLNQFKQQLRPVESLSLSSYAITPKPEALRLNPAEASHTRLPAPSRAL